MDGFLKQPQSKLPPPFPRFVRFGYEGDGEDCGTKHFKATFQIRKWSQIMKDYLKDYSQTL